MGSEMCIRDSYRDPNLQFISDIGTGVPISLLHQHTDIPNRTICACTCKDLEVPKASASSHIVYFLGLAALSASSKRVAVTVVVC